MDVMTIGQVARQTGVGVETVRFYEKQALLPVPDRNSSGYRIYSPAAVERLLFIRHAKAIGFSLTEIRELLFLRVDDEASCLEIKEIAVDKVRDIDHRISALTRMREALTELARTCRKGRSAAECRILESLLADDFRMADGPNDHESKETEE